MVAAYDAQEIGQVTALTPISIGLIHKTFCVTTDKGRFSLQGLHPKLASDGILADYERVLTHLQKHQFPAPRLCLTSEGKSFIEDAEGTRWRMTTWLPGRSTSTVTSDQMVREAAALLGRFHLVMADIDYTFQSTHPLHDTAHHLKRLQEAKEAHAASEWMPKIAHMIEEVEATLPALVLPSGLPRRVVHGDPKISNILFDEEDRGVGVIDLDTCTRHSVLVDLGDAVRSWCRDGTEDIHKPFSIERFQALMEGYASSVPQLDEAELSRLAQAGRLITLELTARFLTDTLEQSYFAWDDEKYPTRAAHNLARSQSMLALAGEMQAATSQLEEIVAQTFQEAP